jgi:hypothetical protein
VSAWIWVLATITLLVLVGLTTLVATRIRRLDRLHVRTDAARAGLRAALERRATAALVLAAELEASGRDRAGGVRAAVADARAAGITGGDREGAENVLGRELAAVPRTGVPDAVLDELVDAEQLLILARRVHNDAVRDTRELRSRRLVRWLHLAGTAPMPDYFEIAEYFEIAGPPSPTTGPGVTTAAPARPPAAPPL